MGDINSSQSNSADQSLRSPLQLVPFTFSNSEHFSYADFQIPRPVNAIMTGGGNNLVYKFMYVTSVKLGLYRVVCKLCGESNTGAFGRISSHFLGATPGSKNNWKQ